MSIELRVNPDGTTSVRNLLLGMLPPRPDQIQRRLKFARYVLPSILPPPPQQASWSTKATQPWGEMLNTRVGDCTCAAVGHAIQVWTANNGPEVTISDQNILSLYSNVSGYDPNTGANDNGAVIQTVLNYVRHNGLDGHRIGAYVFVDPTSQEEVQQASFLFGGLYLGVNLPRSAQSQQVWSVPKHLHINLPQWRPNGWGGHAIFNPDFDQVGLTCITWGEKKKMTWDWFKVYCTECYAIISPDWVTGATPAPNGFDFEALNNDLQQFGPIR